jgi:heme-degrading monooxygenase HmoA
VFIAMNRFRVLKDQAEAFEQVWLGRESYLHQMPGFVSFHLLKGPERADHQLYSSHTVWRSHADFEAWTKSDAFRKAHARAGDGRSQPLTLGHPEFEGFHVIQEVQTDGRIIVHGKDAAQSSVAGRA